MDAAAGMAGAPTMSPPAYDNPTAGFPIAIVIAIGFMVTSLILASYYFLVVRCWLRGAGHSAGGGVGAGLLHRSRRDREAERVSAVFFADYVDGELASGLDPDVVAALPVIKYRRATSAAGNGKGKPAASECAVCLSEFARDEPLKLLPGCAHAFHIDCIDTWLHHNVSCPLCRAVVTGGAVGLVVRDDQYDASGRDLAAAGDGEMRRIGSSCRFPKSGGEQEPIRRSFSMDCFLGDLGRKPPPPPPAKETAVDSEAGPSHPDDMAGSSSSIVAGETSGRFRRLLSSFGLGRSSRSTVLPIHLDP